MATGVLVLSDTHVRDSSGLPAAVFELAERADRILHGGDFVAADVLDVLGTFAPIDGVLGNCDGGELLGRVDVTCEVEIDGVRFGMIHDAGTTAGRHERLRGWFPHADVAVYGHSHMPELERTADGLLVINPGSPVQRRRAPTHTVAWVDIADGGVIDARLVDLDG